MQRIQPNPGAGVALSPVENQKPERGGHLPLMGGGIKSLAVLKRFVELAGGAERPVEVFPMAGEKSRPTERS
ncbi:MAG TPA: hypothetical protein VFZ09_13120 [Archangium sp.]|uniref:hypothetical protein n=1 Tax=Archangium sp. TaxID=1872627 RepID=UPI002E317BDE|nr:hypothetical protein [Archangium sp.]HEX5747177.1 hypothetical protein [Archangium sp.]